MSEFPVGKVTFRGVKFEVVAPEKNDGKTIIALSGTTAIGELPAAIREIPVKKKFDRLVFLYSSAWGAPKYTIRIHYSERKNWIPGMPDPYIDIPMRPGIEVFDWYAGDDFVTGGFEAPRAKLAWAGFSKRSKPRHVGAMLYEWDNPFPEKEIDAIDILSPGKAGRGQPFLIAISGANHKPEPEKCLLREIAPKTPEKDVVMQFENEAYGAVLTRFGTLPAIYLVPGKKRSVWRKFPSGSFRAAVPSMERPDSGTLLRRTFPRKK